MDDSDGENNVDSEGDASGVNQNEIVPLAGIKYPTEIDNSVALSNNYKSQINQNMPSDQQRSQDYPVDTPVANENGDYYYDYYDYYYYPEYWDGDYTTTSKISTSDNKKTSIPQADVNHKPTSQMPPSTQPISDTAGHIGTTTAEISTYTYEYPTDTNKNNPDEYYYPYYPSYYYSDGDDSQSPSASTVTDAPIDCDDIGTTPTSNRASGEYLIYPFQDHRKYDALRVYCDLKTDGGGWTVRVCYIPQSKK